MTRSIARFLFRRFRKLETDVHPLNYLFWECTTRCNLSCLHCGSDCSMNSQMPDMPLPDFLGAIDTIKSKSLITVVLTGGEPLLRRDLEECGRQIRKRGMRWGMVSNGYLYNEERHNALLSAGMGALTISLDGLETSHNWLRNTAGSFDRAVQAITLAASSSRLNFDVVTCVNPRNIGELDEIYDLLLSRRVKAWRLFTIAPIGRAESNRELLLTGDSFRQLMEFIAEKRTLKQMDVKFSCESYTGPYETRVCDGYFFCRAGINIGSILADGSISACPNIDHSFVQGNIYRDNFFDVWQHRYGDFRNRQWARRGKCADCKEFKDCLGNGLHLWHGDKENVLVCYNDYLQKN
ncbi:MAG TPA: TIGR04133 family radical SAM/SPASM protein [Bacteroidales bacterium]|nr:TIGR04133 family radical SAM/SPASM protein [Bacteroidales bacterium]